MICAHYAFDNPHIQAIAYLPDQVTTSLLNLATKNAIAILRTENQMHMELIDAVGSSPLLHEQNLREQMTAWPD